MRQLIPLLLAIFAVVGLATGCGNRAADSTGAAGAATIAEVTDAEAEEAFLLSFGLMMISSMAAIYDQPLEGTLIDYETGVIGFEDFQVSVLGIDSRYTAVSGSATPGDDSMMVAMRLTGGPVTTIAYEITGSQLSVEEALKITVVANGKSIPLELSADEMFQ